MVEEVRCYKANDGSFFNTKREAKRHELFLIFMKSYGRDPLVASFDLNDDGMCVREHITKHRATISTILDDLDRIDEVSE